ncbi:helix-turn-helix domain-containing protein [Deinococcus marmoris]|nr:helix-turn-helix transcriptional regulator [Deinococcus marmoris]
MAAVRWRLSDVLEEHGITAYALAKAGGIDRMGTVYRIARRGHEPSRIDLPTLARIVTGLRQLTGQEIQISDILEYVFDPSEESGPVNLS